MKATVNNINHEFWQYNMSIKSQEMFSVYIVYFIKDLDVYSLNFYSMFEQDFYQKEFVKTESIIKC